MPASDKWGTYKTPCFQVVIVEHLNIPFGEETCGGEVSYSFWGSDDSYSPGGYSIMCKKCRKKYTFDQWGYRK